MKFAFHTLVFFFFLCVVSSVVGQSWIAVGNGVQIPGTVYAIQFSLNPAAPDYGSLYVGGNFQSAGNTLVNNIARYPSASQWQALGVAPTPAGTGGTVQVLSYDYNAASVIVGGLFQSAGSNNVNYVTLWNSSAWVPLSTGTGGPGNVNAVTVDSTQNPPAYYVGGNFNTAGSIGSNFIAKWDGNSWSSLSQGTTAIVTALSYDSFSTSVYVGGQFTNIGGSYYGYVARWSIGGSSKWNSIGNGTNGVINYITTDNTTGTIYFGGQFTAVYQNSSSVPVTVNYIAKWSGTAWSSMANGTNGVVNCMAFDSTSSSLYVGGQFTMAGAVAASHIAKWSAGAWSALATGATSAVNAIIIQQQIPYFAYSNVVANYTGGAVSVYINNLFQTSQVNAVVYDRTNALLYAGGTFTQSLLTPLNYVGVWNGATWAALGSGVSGVVNALAVSSTGLLFVGGTFTSAGSLTVNNVARWNGTWTAMGNGTNGLVSALCVDAAGNAYVGGSFTTVTGIAASSIAVYSAAGQWSALSSGLTGSANALVYSPLSNCVYVGGSFSAPATNIALWNITSSSFQALSGGVNGQVSALASDDVTGAIFAGGSFTSAGGVSGFNRVGKWTGTTWSTIASGTQSAVNALAYDTSTSTLYLGGHFQVTTVYVNILSWVNGASSLNVVGNGVNNIVNALAADNTTSSVYLGGLFTTSGAGSQAFGVVKWGNLAPTPSPTPSPTPAPTASPTASPTAAPTASPNPASTPSPTLSPGNSLTQQSSLRYVAMVGIVVAFIAN